MKKYLLSLLFLLIIHLSVFAQYGLTPSLVQTQATVHLSSGIYGEDVQSFSIDVPEDAQMLYVAFYTYEGDQSMRDLGNTLLQGAAQAVARGRAKEIAPYISLPRSSGAIKCSIGGSGGTKSYGEVRSMLTVLEDHACTGELTLTFDNDAWFEGINVAFNVVALMPSDLADYRESQGYVHLGDRAYERKDYLAALFQYQESLEYFPSGKATAGQALSLIFLGQGELARESCAEAMALIGMQRCSKQNYRLYLSEFLEAKKLLTGMDEWGNRAYDMSYSEVLDDCIGLIQEHLH